MNLQVELFLTRATPFLDFAAEFFGVDVSGLKMGTLWHACLDDTKGTQQGPGKLQFFGVDGPLIATFCTDCASHVVEVWVGAALVV